MDMIDGMRAFAHVADEGSFTKAADRLNLTTKLVSKYVRQLEERVGAQLLNRTTRSVGLTEAGRAYLERARPLLEGLDELHQIVAENQDELIGSIRLSASTNFGSSKLIQPLSEFMKANPKVSVELDLTDRLVDVVEEGFDLVIRIATLRDSALKARKLRDMRIVLAASPDYLERTDRPAKPADLKHHACLAEGSSPARNAWDFRISGKLTRVGVTGPFKTSAPRALAEMAACGLGIARLPHYSAEPYLADERLVLLLE
ncbi:MAG: LysR family transcriptional regulator, partial [Pseudomonadota bacterium]